MIRLASSARLRRDRRPNAAKHGDTTSEAPATAEPAAPLTSRRVTGRLVALSASAVLTVYSAGYQRTRATVERIAGAVDDRRSVGRATSTQPVQTIAEPKGAGAIARGPQPIQGLSSETPATPVEARGGRRLAPNRQRGPKKDQQQPRPVNDDGQRRAPAVPIGTSQFATDGSSLPPAGLLTTLHVPGQASAATAMSASATPPQPGAMNLPADALAAPATSGYKDGTYLGWGTSRHGDIQASVVIAGGRIASASVAQCLTRYPCSWIASLPGQVVTRQSPKVDYVSGATQSTHAFSDAVIDALRKAR